MTDLQADLARARTAKGDSIQAKQSAEELAADALTALQARIIAGGTTGDRFLDYLAVRFGIIDDTFCERYRDLDRTLKGQEGQLVLVHHRVQVPWKHVFGKGTEYREETQCFLAILTGDALVVTIEEDTARCSLPIARYASQAESYKIADGALFETSRRGIFVTEDCYQGLPPGPSAFLGFRHVHGEDSSLTVIAGDEPVIAWLRGHMWFPMQPHREPERFKLLLEQLGRLDLSPPPEVRSEE